MGEPKNRFLSFPSENQPEKGTTSIRDHVLKPGPGCLSLKCTVCFVGPACDAGFPLSRQKRATWSLHDPLKMGQRPRYFRQRPHFLRVMETLAALKKERRRYDSGGRNGFLFFFCGQPFAFRRGSVHEFSVCERRWVPGRLCLAGTVWGRLFRPVVLVPPDVWINTERAAVDLVQDELVGTSCPG